MHFNLNIGFAFSAMLTLLFILFHLLFLFGSKNREVVRSFEILLAIGTVEVIAEICSLVLFRAPQNHPFELLYLVVTIQAMMRCILPFALLTFVLYLCNEFIHPEPFLLFLACLPFVVALIITFTSPWMHGFFQIDSDSHALQINPSAYVTIVYTALYTFFAVAIALFYRPVMRRRDFILVIEFASILVATTAAECIFTDLTTGGLGLSLACLVMLLSLHNPFSATDSLTGAFEATAFREDAQRLIKLDRPFEVVFVVLHFPERLSHLFSSNLIDKSLILSVNAFVKATTGRHVYRLAPYLIASIVSSRRERQVTLSKLNKFFKSRHAIDSVTLSLDASISFLSFDESAESADELLRFVKFAADSLAQREKRGHPFIAPDSEQLKKSYRRQALVHHCIQEALNQDLFTVYLQPLWSLSQKRFVGAEALARLIHPTEGFISPGEFIPIAEKEGYISEIGRRQFRKLCRFTEENDERLRELGIDTIKVNVSATEISNPDFPVFLKRTMTEHHLDPSAFQFEITETVATSLDDSTTKFLNALSSGGSKLCMDDFGSGFANLSMIRSLPFDVVKIDSSLLQNVVNDTKAASLYHDILCMMENLGMETVCEGVETAQEVELLSRWHANVIQGFYFARPMPFDTLLEGSWV